MINQVIPEFDKFLEKTGLRFEGTVIGGAALLVLEITDRLTKDVDCLFPKIPEEIKVASRVFAATQNEIKVEEDWFNNGPTQLAEQLPVGWQDRLIPLYNGVNLVLTTLGRDDFLKTKLFAYCDRTEPDFGDLLKLKPNAQELDDSIEWVKECDRNINWPAHVEHMFLLLKEELGE